ncbi:premnaspirodiene oxygenase-like isoform X1 [Ricinus communis]|uniref:premnaspirodiene oxygenase-like isoform X1 n=1 Tax=Ricinus communis TaxID=3988 RepID=UPI00201A241C|nr:premnaspirodiene oxygenase-like isoform X1 [Ricinus communis]
MEHLHQFPFFPAFFCFLLFIFVIQSKRTKSEVSNSSSKLPPGPRKLPIIGNMLQLIGSLLHHRLRDLATQYGPVMHLQLGEVSNFVISSPEAAREVMKTHDISFAQRPFVLAASIVMYNFKDIVFAPYGDQWRQLRKICILELLSLKRVQSFRSVREEEVLFLVNSISSNAGSPINLGKMVLSLSSTLTLRNAFGKFCKQKDEFVPLVKKILLMLEGFSVADTFPSFKFLHGLTGIRRKLERLHQEADTILENIIKEHRDNKASGRSDMKSEAVDLVDVLLNLHDHGNLEFPFTTDNIKAVMLDLFIAGTESSSGIIEWAMAEMIKNSRVLGKAQEEVRQIFNKKQCIIDETGLQELKYLKLVIKETLRLHPPAPLLLPRECREKVEVCGYEIPVNAKVIVNAWAIGRDPRYWNEAEKFFPERFLDNSIDYKGNDFEFIPFGAGRRMCPGISYGMAVIELSLANLLYHFDWKLPDGMEPKDFDMSESFGVTARKKNELFLIPIPYQP